MSGGAAFPSPGVVIDGRSHQKQQGAYAGMTLRDYFASQVLSTLYVQGGAEDLQDIAKVAYGLADAMLVERAK